MSVKRDREDMERTERAAKIHAHLSKGVAKAEPKAKPGATKVETTTDYPSETAPGVSPEAQPPKPVPCLLIPPLRGWERQDNLGRRFQFRPQTLKELDLEQDRIFMASQFAQDQVHAAKVSKAVQEAKDEQADRRKRAEHEARTGKRPYESGRYIPLEEARARGFLEVQGGDNRPSESNPQGLFCGGGGNGRRR